MNAPAQHTPEAAEAPSFCGIHSAELVFAGPRTRAEFDRLALPGTVHEWTADRATTLIKNDGRQWERRCHSKLLGDYSKGSVTVIFQWFDERPVEATAQGGAS